MEKRYSITEVSEMYEINANTLRYYERIGLLKNIPRQKSGNRYFTEDILKWLEMIVCLRHSGVSIEVLKKYANLVRLGDETLEEREQLLREQEKVLIEKEKNLQLSLKRLRHKISLYESGEIKNENSYYDEYGIIFDDKDKFKN